VWRETGAACWSGSWGSQPEARSCSRRRPLRTLRSRPAHVNSGRVDVDTQSVSPSFLRDHKK
jgi:hypothetical protein